MRPMTLLHSTWPEGVASSMTATGRRRRLPLSLGEPGVPVARSKTGMANVPWMPQVTASGRRLYSEWA